MEISHSQLVRDLFAVKQGQISLIHGIQVIGTVIEVGERNEFNKEAPKRKPGDVVDAWAIAGGPALALLPALDALAKAAGFHPN